MAYYGSGLAKENINSILVYEIVSHLGQLTSIETAYFHALS